MVCRILVLTWSFGTLGPRPGFGAPPTTIRQGRCPWYHGRSTAACRPLKLHRTETVRLEGPKVYTLTELMASSATLNTPYLGASQYLKHLLNCFGNALPAESMRRRSPGGRSNCPAGSGG